MEAAGIAVVETAVGDRYVLEALDAGGYSLGGEQSGHVIFRDLATTGDGLLAGLVLRRRRPRARDGRSPSSPPTAMTPLPQVLVNVPVDAPMPDVAERARRRDRRPPRPSSAATGRVLVRPSGTEPLVRVMVEAPTAGAGRRRGHDRLADRRRG